MLDINLIRDHPEIVQASQKRRGEDPQSLDSVLDLDGKWRTALTRINDLRRQRNERTQEISRVKKEGGDASETIKRMKMVSTDIKDLERTVKELQEERDSAIMALPNILDATVPPGETEDDDVPIRFVGTAKVPTIHLEHFHEATGGNMDFHEVQTSPISHTEITDLPAFADIPRAAKVAGARFYYLKNQFVFLDLALQHFGLAYLRERGYEIIQPPYMLNRRAMEGVTDLSAFEETLYKVEGEDLHLIATSEHPLGAMFMDEIFEYDEFPKKFAGISPCFRKEAGAHGKDTKGIFRVHQFNKIEQFIFCHPEESWNFFDELIANAEGIYQELGIPYRVLDICAGDMGAIASKKLDLECWMPSSGRFREIVSISNALDYQARRLNIRFRTPEGNIMVHTLNGTAIATSRTMVAIMENHQEDGVIRIPDALRKYTGFDEIDLRCEE